MITNKVTRAVFELIGDKVKGGYKLKAGDVEVPLFLNKDGTTVYPQIRISPFIDKGDIKYQRYIEEENRAYRHWKHGAFQIDIYTKNLALAQNIYDIIEARVYDFFNLQTIMFDYNNEFEEIAPNIYRTQSYALLDDDLFKDIYGITVDDHIIKRVYNKENLNNETFFVNNEYLYVSTSYDIKKIHIKVLTQGRLFSNGFCASDNGIHDYRLNKERNLSSLEDNEVERISFDLEILFSNVLDREELPRVDHVKVKYPKINMR